MIYFVVLAWSNCIAFLELVGLRMLTGKILNDACGFWEVRDMVGILLECSREMRNSHLRVDRTVRLRGK